MTLKRQDDPDNSGEEVNDNPIEQVRLTVPITDDPDEPALTFRTWTLGILSCCILSFVNQFFSYRQNQLTLDYVCIQIIAFPIGKLMAATLPVRTFAFLGWSFSLNPGPFTIKEHVLITIFASCGADGAYALDIVTIIKALYHRNVSLVGSLLLVQTTQLLGYGFAGLFRKYLVDSPFMWWPQNLVQVSLFRTLHEKEKRRRGVTRLQFFIIVFIASFAYYVIPGYLFPSLSNLAFICWIWKDSVLAQQIGSARTGFGIGSFGLDWATTSFIGNPLASPFFTIVNTMVGFIFFIYIFIPIAYYMNAYEAKRFPLMSSKTFDSTGKRYDITRILDQKSFKFNEAGYDGYSKLYMSITFAFAYGFNFANLTAVLSHVFLFDGKTIWDMWKRTTSSVSDKFSDVHTRLMKKNYEQVPQWWFHVVLLASFGLALFACEGFGKQLQLPWWGLILACGIAFVFTLPIGVIQATTNLQPGLNVITELIIGYLYPGKPLANVTFKTYGYISMYQALSLIQDFKLGHYMKIPPKSMFIVQLVGTIVASTCSFSTAWWIINAIPNICDDTKLSPSSPWTCPNYNVFYNASIIWGVISPVRMFTNAGIYPGLNWFFLIGAVAPVPVWWLSRKFPEKKWIRLIHIPLMINGTQGIPPAGPVHFWSWAAIGTFFNYYIYNKYRSWWARYNYVLSAGLGAGIAVMGVLLFFALQYHDIAGPEWWGLDVGDHCPLSSCPTAPGIVTHGCPTFSN